MKPAMLAVAALALFSFTAVHAQDFHLSNLTISHPWARPTAEGQKIGAAYLSITNGGGEADKLVSAESPAAQMTHLHQTIDEGGVMKMRAVKDGIEIQPGGQAEFKPGGSHIMLMGLNQPLVEGQTIPLTLTFAKAGTVNVEVKVEKSNGAEGMPHHH